MRIFFYIGPNKQVKSGFSIKFWKIQRKGKKIIVHWGPARLDHLKRKILSASWTQHKAWTFGSEGEARANLKRRIAAQIGEGYYRLPKRRR